MKVAKAKGPTASDPSSNPLRMRPSSSCGAQPSCGRVPLVAVRRRRVQPRWKLRHAAGEFLPVAAFLSSRHGVEQVERLLVQPHRCQHGERLVIVQFVARLDRLDPACTRHAPKSKPPRATQSPSQASPLAESKSPSGNRLKASMGNDDYP